MCRRRSAQGPCRSRTPAGNAGGTGPTRRPAPRRRSTDRQWRRRRRSGQHQRARDGGDDEDRPAAQVQRRDRGRVADAATQPVSLFVERMEAHQQEQARDREDHQERQLAAQGERHVGEQQQPDDHHGVDRPPVSERRVARELGGGPRDQAEHEQVMAERRGEQEPVDDEVGIGAARLRRSWPGTGGPAEPPPGIIAQPTRSGSSSAAKTAPMAWVFQRAQPTRVRSAQAAPPIAAQKRSRSAGRGRGPAARRPATTRASRRRAGRARP